MRSLNQLNTKDSFSAKVSFCNSHKLLIGALALIFVAGMASPAFALTIDLFETGTENVEALNTGDSDFTTTTGIDPNETIGESRFTNVTKTSGIDSVMGELLPQPNPTIISFSSDGTSTGLFYLKYDADGDGLSDSGCLDLTLGGSGNSIFIDFFFADSGALVEVTVMDSDTDSASQTIAIGAGDPDLDYLYVNFDNQGNIDFDCVEKIEIEITGEIAGDYIIEMIGVPQTRIGGTVGSMDTATLLVAGAQANMGLWSLALVGVVAAGAAITYKLKSKKTKQ